MEPAAGLQAGGSRTPKGGGVGGSAVRLIASAGTCLIPAIVRATPLARRREKASVKSRTAPPIHRPNRGPPLQCMLKRGDAMSVSLPAPMFGPSPSESMRHPDDILEVEQLSVH